MKIRSLIVLFLCLLAQPSFAAAIVYEGFDYSAGSSLAGASGGMGWTSNWIHDYPIFGNFTVASSSLNHAGINSNGGSLSSASSSEDSRSFATLSSGKVWISVLANLVNNSFGTDEIRLKYNGGWAYAIGSNDGYSNYYLMDKLNTPSAGNRANTGVAINSGVHLLVMEIDYAANKTSLWVDPATTGFAGTGGVSINYTSAIDSIALYSRSGAAFDEIRIGTSASDVGVTTVPEPGSVGLLALAAVGLFARVRLHRV